MKTMRKMKNEIRRFLNYPVWMMVLALVICVVSNVETAAQEKSKPVSKPKIYWYMDYTVRVKGNGTLSDEGGEPKIKWSIDRTYSGGLKLDNSGTVGTSEMENWSQQEVMNAMKTNRFTAFYTLTFDTLEEIFYPYF